MLIVLTFVRKTQPLQSNVDWIKARLEMSFSVQAKKKSLQGQGVKGSELWTFRSNFNIYLFFSFFFLDVSFHFHFKHIRKKIFFPLKSWKHFSSLPSLSLILRYWEIIFPISPVMNVKKWMNYSSMGVFHGVADATLGLLELPSNGINWSQQVKYILSVTMILPQICIHNTWYGHLDRCTNVLEYLNSIC